MNKTTALVATILLALLSLTVGAQVYRWVDKDGKVQYSDQPPPPGAGKSEVTKINSSTPAAGTAAPAAAPKAPEKDKAADKGKAADAENAKNTAEAAKVAKQNEESCREARGQARALQDGGRIARTNEAGERTLLSDEQIAAELAKVQKFIAENCK